MSHEIVQVHTVVIGGGIIGLTTALELKRRFKTEEITLLEQAPFLADHSTGRNSGVLHSGLYYDHGSLKHRLCMEGLEYWRELIKRYNLPHRWCGKFVFAHKQDELSSLVILEDRAKANGVPFHRATQNELAVIRKNVNAIDAIFIESTGILDAAAAVAAIKNDFESLGGMIQTSTPALKIQKHNADFLIETPDFSILTKQLINAAGLWAPELRTQLGLKNMTSYWVKGHYLKSSQKLDHATLYYPVPPADLKGLGVHSTIDCQGDVKFGPDTLDVSEIDYNLSPDNLSAMRASIEERFVDVDIMRLKPDYAGIRSKIKVDGKLHKDFWIKGSAELGIPGYTEACGIESPGLTSAPAIAQMLCELLD